MQLFASNFSHLAGIKAYLFYEITQNLLPSAKTV